MLLGMRTVRCSSESIRHVKLSLSRSDYIAVMCGSVRENIMNRGLQEINTVLVRAE